MDLSHHGGIAKVERYKWTVKDEPGRLMHIHKGKLLIDHSYQRSEITDHKTLSFASAWSWVACGTISVAKRGGDFYVIDGQHRVLASLRRSDIDTLPCIVFESTGIESEADAFLTLNSSREALRAVDRLRAMVRKGDPIAIKVQRMIEASGRSPSTSPSPKTIACIGTLLRIAAKRPKILDSIWPVITDVCTDYSIDARLVEGLAYVEQNMQEGFSISNTRFKNRLVQIGPASLIDGVNRASSLYSKGGPRVWAVGIIETLNKGLKSKFKLRESDEEIT